MAQLPVTDDIVASETTDLPFPEVAEEWFAAIDVVGLYITFRNKTDVELRESEGRVELRLLELPFDEFVPVLAVELLGDPPVTGMKCAGMPHTIPPDERGIGVAALEETHRFFPPFLCWWASTQATTWFEKNVSRPLGPDRRWGSPSGMNFCRTVQAEQQCTSSTWRMEIGAPNGCG